MLRVALIIRQCTHIGFHYLPYATISGTSSDVTRSGLLLSQRLAQTFDGNIDPDYAAIAEKIDDRFGDRKDRNEHALDVVVFYPSAQLLD